MELVNACGENKVARRCRLFKEFIGNNKRLVLEIGCGTGLFTKELAATDNTIIAIDISDALIKKAKERVHTKTSNLLWAMPIKPSSSQQL